RRRSPGRCVRAAPAVARSWDDAPTPEACFVPPATARLVELVGPCRLDSQHSRRVPYYLCELLIQDTRRDKKAKTAYLGHNLGTLTPNELVSSRRPVSHRSCGKRPPSQRLP